MATIQITAGLKSLDNGIQVRSATTELVGEDTFIAAAINVGVTPEALSYGEVVTPRTIAIKCVSGDDLLISVDGPAGSWPFRLSAGQATVLRLDTETLVETQTVTTAADVSRSLSGKYLNLYDRNGLVRPWINVASQPEISTITTVADVSGSLDGKYFIIYDDTGTSVGVWIDIDNTGTAEPAHGATRGIEVSTILTDASAADVAGEIQLALDADGAFGAAWVPASSLVTVTNATNAAVTNIAAGDSGFTVGTTQEGTNPSTAPADGGGRLVQVDILENDTANAVATAIVAAFAADAELEVTTALNVVTLEDKHPGTRTDIADVDTGFSVATTQQGVAGAADGVEIKSEGNSLVNYAAAPY